MRIEDTGGNITYTIDNCDCGLTGGCWKCQPIRISWMSNFYGLSYPEFDRAGKPLIDTRLECGVNIKDWR